MPSASYRLGRLLQVIGLLVLPGAIAAELAGKVSLGQAMLIALAGAGAFMFGSRMVPDRT